MSFFLKSASLLPLSLGLMSGAAIVTYPPDLSGGTNFSFYRLAVPFLLTSIANINQVTFWIADNPSSLPRLFSGDVSWAFYTNTVGSNVPGAILNEGTTKPSVVPTGQCSMFCESRVDFNLPMGIQLASGTYWLELHDGMTLNSTPGGAFWIRSFADPVSAGGLGYVFSTDLNVVPSEGVNALLALQLSDAADVPEPATVSLMLVGLAAICSGAIQKHRSASR